VANIDKLVVQWGGFNGAPGYSVFYATPGNLVRADIISFFSSVNDWIPSGVSLSIPSSGDTVDDATGVLTGTWTEGTDLVLNGSAGGIYAAPAGCCITWDTSGIANGRRVRGRTFLVPLGGNALATDGSLENIALQDIRSSAAALVGNAGGNLLVWHRPVAGAGGSSHPVVASRVADKVAVLRSRRD
jgi:hypothetical protein